MEQKEPKLKKLIEVKKKDLPKLKAKAFKKDVPVKTYIEQLIEADLKSE